MNQLKIQLKTNSKALTSIVMLTLASMTGALAALSITNDRLFSPFGIIVTERAAPALYYLGLSAYISIATLLVIAATIRIAKDIEQGN